ncbi:hypothetical protein CITRIK5_50369 [Citricoccus sp. K5]|nr:hypothetical protein CITRIK5_50369 [Citricoccus sp. K5]
METVTVKLRLENCLVFEGMGDNVADVNLEAGALAGRTTLDGCEAALSRALRRRPHLPDGQQPESARHRVHGRPTGMGRPARGAVRRVCTAPGSAGRRGRCRCPAAPGARLGWASLPA